MSYEEAYWRRQKVCVTGGAGFLGRVLCRRLRTLNCRAVMVPRRDTYDLTQADAVRRMYHDCTPDIVFHLAAEVGGIQANRRHPGRFLHANLAMGMHLIDEGRSAGVQQFVQVGTVCSYPKYCPVPFRETRLWEGYPEESNAPYGIAKKTLLVMLDAYRREYGFNYAYVLPANLYGPGDNFDPRRSHVIPALIRRFHEAVANGESVVRCWGTGQPSREFLYVDDAAKAIVRAAACQLDGQPINIGTGVETSIAELANLIAELTGYAGSIEWDASQPDGQPRRRLDVSRAEELLGWRASVDLRTGLGRTVDWWVQKCAADAQSPAEPTTDSSGQSVPRPSGSGPPGRRE